MSNLLNKLTASKRDASSTMTHWIWKKHNKPSTLDDVSSDDDEDSLEIVITKQKKEEGKKPEPKKGGQMRSDFCKKLADDSDEESEKSEEIRITKVDQSGMKKRKVPDEVTLVKVTPPKRNKYKQMSKEELLGDENVGFESDEEESEYHVIHSMCRNDGGNILTYVPGYTALWKCPVYMKLMHQSLYHEINVWCREIKKFLHKLDNEWDEDPALDTDTEKKQKEHILESVTRMETTVLKKVLVFNTVVIHSLSIQSIMMSFPGCSKRLAKLVHYMCRSKSYHIRFFIIVGAGETSYDIGTLLSIGHEWHFDQWDDLENQEE